MKVETMQATARRPDKRRAMARRADAIRKAAEDRERVRRIIRITQNGFKKNEGRIMLEYPGAAPGMSGRESTACAWKAGEKERGVNG